MQSRCLVACLAGLGQCAGAMRRGPVGGWSVSMQRFCHGGQQLSQRWGRKGAAELHVPFTVRTGFRRCNAIHFEREIGPLALPPKVGRSALKLSVPLGSSLLPPWKRLRQHTRHLHAVAQASVLRLARPSACHCDAGRAVVACRCAQARPYSQNPR